MGSSRLKIRGGAAAHQNSPGVAARRFVRKGLATKAAREACYWISAARHAPDPGLAKFQANGGRHTRYRSRSGAPKGLLRFVRKGLATNVARLLDSGGTAISASMSPVLQGSALDALTGV
jgi:hypothetical protein